MQSLNKTHPLPTKQAVRQAGLNARNAMAPSEWEEAAKAILAHASEHMELSQKDVVAAYVPITGEVDPMPLLCELAYKGQAIALPVVEERDAPMSFRAYFPDDALEKNPYHGFMQPLDGAEYVSPDVLLVPSVAFDSRGFRIGMGKGYYDRTLEFLANLGEQTRTVGLAYSCQQVGYVPSESHDVALDMIITEKGVIRP